MLSTAAMRQFFPLAIALIMNTSCGGPNVVFEPGEYTQRLPETTRTVEQLKPQVEQMQPIVNRSAEEQRKLDQLKAIQESAGIVAKLEAERALKVLTERGNFLNASAFSREAGANLCVLKTLIVSEALIDSSKLIGLAEEFSNCPSPSPIRLIRQTGSIAELEINVPSFWIAKHIHLDPKLKIKARSANLTLIAEHLHIDTFLSARSSLRLGSIRTHIGQNAFIDLSPESDIPQSPDFRSLAAHRKNEIIASALQNQVTGNPSLLSIDPRTHPNLESARAHLLTQAIHGILNAQNFNSSCLDLNQATRQKLGLFTVLRQAEIMLQAGRNKRGDQEFIFGKFDTTEYRAGRYRKNPGPYLLARYSLIRSATPKQNQAIILQPNLIAASTSKELPPGRLQLLATLPLNQSLPVDVSKPDSPPQPEFSPFESFQTEVPVSMTLRLEIDHYIPPDYGNSGSWAICNVLLKPQEFDLTDHQSITLHYQAPEPSRNFRLSSQLIQPLRENEVVVSPDRLWSEIRDWEIPSEAYELKPLHTFKTLSENP